LSEYLRHRWAYTIQQNRISNIPATASRFVKAQAGESVTSMISQELVYDTRDSKLTTSEGALVRFNTDFAGIGGGQRFVRIKGSAAYFYPIREKWIFTSAVEGGYIFGINQKVRINDRFFLGGENLRGFRFAGVGPRDLTAGADDALGGNRYMRGELTAPAPFLSDDVGLKTHLFSDWGVLGEVEDKPLPTEIFKNDETLRASIGFGMTWESPFGPVRLDYVQPVLKKNYDKIEKFRFSFGTRF
jgi:outer membrane protein insertion porin family